MPISFIVLVRHGSSIDDLFHALNLKILKERLIFVQMKSCFMISLDPMPANGFQTGFQHVASTNAVVICRVTFFFVFLPCITEQSNATCVTTRVVFTFKDIQSTERDRQNTFTLCILPCRPTNPGPKLAIGEDRIQEGIKRKKEKKIERRREMEDLEDRKKRKKIE